MVQRVEERQRETGQRERDGGGGRGGGGGGDEGEVTADNGKVCHNSQTDFVTPVLLEGEEAMPEPVKHKGMLWACCVSKCNRSQLSVALGRFP